MARRGSRSAPAGSAVLAQMRSELERGWPAGLTLLTGEDLYHLDAAQAELLSALVAEKDAEYGLTVYSDRKVDVAVVVGAARSVGMFAARRVVLVRDAEILDGDPRSLVEYAKRPPADSYLIVRAPKLDRRRKLPLALAKSPTICAFQPLADPETAAADITAIARAKGLRPDRDAAVFLLDICGGDFYRVDSELEKIRCWIGAKEEQETAVSADVVREVAAGSGLLSGWEVADAVLVRDRPQALASMRRLLQSGSEPLQLLGGVAYRARSMLTAKLLIEAGKETSQAMRSARIWGTDPRLVARGLARYSVADLLGFPRRLFEADCALKSRSIAPEAVLGQMIEQMTGTRTREPAAGRR